ncbi:MAG: Mur ligase family protein [Candidatus Buchananbacteria bacterium]
MKNNFSRYSEAVTYIESVFNLSQPQTKNHSRLNQARFEYFLRLLGQPQKNQKYIHVGGTAGKGSVATMIHSILTAAGLKAGLYVSPHPTTTIERFKIGNKHISPKEFCDILDEIKPKIDLVYTRTNFGRMTYYEILAAMAFIFFQKNHCDWVVLEVGLGGLHDATNVIPPAKITVINQISLDHTKVLGNTLKQIARIKSGIIKNKTIFFTPDTNHASVQKILKKACQKHQATFNLVKSRGQNYKINLIGQKQKENAVLAAAVARRIGIVDEKIKAGLRSVKIPCRFEIIQKKPLIILDGAHNIAKINAVAQNLKNLTYKRLYLIIALTNERNGGKIFKSLADQAELIVATRYLTSKKKCLPPLRLAQQLKTKKKIMVSLDPFGALNKVLKLATADDLILITGSFYLAGELRKKWIPEERILKNLTS